jgi:hypothetical protein
VFTERYGLDLYINTFVFTVFIVKMMVTFGFYTE